MEPEQDLAPGRMREGLEQALELRELPQPVARTA